MAEKRRKNTAYVKKVSASFREHARNKRIAGLFVTFLVVIVAFMAGFALRSNVQFTELLGFNVGSETMNSGKVSKPAKTTYDALSARVDEVEDILSTYSLDEVHLATATDTMLTDMLRSTEDPYAEYYDQERYEAYIKEAVSKGYQGIGVLFGDYNGRAYAIDVLDPVMSGRLPRSSGRLGAWKARTSSSPGCAPSAWTLRMATSSPPPWSAANTRRRT